MVQENMAFVRVGALSDIPPGTAIHIDVGDSSDQCDAVAICNVEGELYAIDGICPHSGGPLGEGGLHGRILVCPYHAWEFDCVTGLSPADDTLRQARYEVKVANGEVLVNLP